MTLDAVVVLPGHDQQRHGDGRGMPAAGGQPLEEAVVRIRLAEVKGLRIKAGGEGFDLCGIQRMGATGEALPGMEVFEVKPRHPFMLGGCADPGNMSERAAQAVTKEMTLGTKLTLAHWPEGAYSFCVTSKPWSE